MSRKDPSTWEIISGLFQLAFWSIALPFLLLQLAILVIGAIFDLIMATLEGLNKAIALMKLFWVTCQAERKRLRAERGLDKK